MDVLPQDYITKDSKNICRVEFNKNNDSDIWVLGEAFLKGWYAAHDHANKKFGFAPHKTSTKLDPLAGTVPLVELPSSDFPVWAIVLLSVAGAAILGISVWLVVDFICIGNSNTPEDGASLVDVNGGVIVLLE